MTAFYSIKNKDLTIYNDKGTCLIILNRFDIYDIMKKFHLSDSDIHICI